MATLPGARVNWSLFGAAAASPAAAQPDDDDGVAFKARPGDAGRFDAPLFTAAPPAPAAEAAKELAPPKGVVLGARCAPPLWELAAGPK